jgi:hypothetical protein
VAAARAVVGEMSKPRKAREAKAVTPVNIDAALKDMWYKYTLSPEWLIVHPDDETAVRVAFDKRDALARLKAQHRKKPTAR